MLARSALMRHRRSLRGCSCRPAEGDLAREEVADRVEAVGIHHLLQPTTLPMEADIFSPPELNRKPWAKTRFRQQHRRSSGRPASRRCGSGRCPAAMILQRRPELPEQLAVGCANQQEVDGDDVIVTLRIKMPKSRILPKIINTWIILVFMFKTKLK